MGQIQGEGVDIQGLITAEMDAQWQLLEVRSEALEVYDGIQAATNTLLDGLFEQFRGDERYVSGQHVISTEQFSQAVDLWAGLFLMDRAESTDSSQGEIPLDLNEFAAGSAPALQLASYFDAQLAEDRVFSVVKQDLILTDPDDISGEVERMPGWRSQIEVVKHYVAPEKDSSLVYGIKRQEMPTVAVKIGEDENDILIGYDFFVKNRPENPAFASSDVYPSLAARVLREQQLTARPLRELVERETFAQLVSQYQFLSTEPAYRQEFRRDLEAERAESSVFKTVSDIYGKLPNGRKHIAGDLLDDALTDEERETVDPYSKLAMDIGKRVAQLDDSALNVAVTESVIEADSRRYIDLTAVLHDNPESLLEQYKAKAVAAELEKGRADLAEVNARVASLESKLNAGEQSE